MAKRYQVETTEVILLPVGAVAMIDVPQGTRQELSIAIAGPLVSMLLGCVFFGLSFVLVAPEAVVSFPLWSTPQELFFYLGVLNGAIGAFNLIPAFPMDGGRILRSILAQKFGLLVGTKHTVSVALVLSAVGGGLALYYGHFFLLLITVFVFLGSQGEYRNLKKQDEREAFKDFARRIEAGLKDIPEDQRNSDTGIRLEAVIEEMKNEEELPKPTINIGKFLTIFILSGIFWSYVAADFLFFAVMNVGGSPELGKVATFVFIVVALIITMKLTKPIYKEKTDESV